MSIDLNLMGIFLLIVLAIIAVSFWRAQQHMATFDAFDLLMENGKVSKIAIAFLLVLLVTTWVIVDLQLKGNLTEGYFMAYGGMWVMPLVAKVVFNKAEMPTNTTVKSMTETTVTQEKP